MSEDDMKKVLFCLLVARNNAKKTDLLLAEMYQGAVDILETALGISDMMSEEVDL